MVPATLITNHSNLVNGSSGNVIVASSTAIGNRYLHYDKICHSFARYPSDMYKRIAKLLLGSPFVTLLVPDESNQGRFAVEWLNDGTDETSAQGKPATLWRELLP